MLLAPNNSPGQAIRFVQTTFASNWEQTGLHRPIQVLRHAVADNSESSMQYKDKKQKQQTNAASLCIVQHSPAWLRLGDTAMLSQISHSSRSTRASCLPLRIDWSEQHCTTINHCGSCCMRHLLSRSQTFSIAPAKERILASRLTCTLRAHLTRSAHNHCMLSTQLMSSAARPLWLFCALLASQSHLAISVNLTPSNQPFRQSCTCWFRRRVPPLLGRPAAPQHKKHIGCYVQ